MSDEPITIDVEDEQPTDYSDDSDGRSTLFLLARLCFAVPLGVMALNHWRDMDGAIGYAEAKGVPNAEQVVPAAVGMLSFGSIGIALWRLPTLAAGAVATYLVGVTPQMHDFWAVDEEEKQAELVNFLKNLGLLGGALAFLVKAQQD